MLQGIDISNLQGPPSAYRNQPWYRDAAFVIVQAIEPPRGYPGHDFIDPETGRRGYTGIQLRAAKEDGKYVGAYPWLWNGLPDTAADITHRLDTVPQSVTLDMRPYVDTEDTFGGPSAMGLLILPEQYLPVERQLLREPRPIAPSTFSLAATSRMTDVLTALAAADRWAAGRGLPAAGGYSGDWYIFGYLAGWWPADRHYWTADYNARVGARLHPLSPVHQFTSTPIDMDVMLESEIVTRVVEDDVLIPDDVVEKFHLTDNHNVMELIDNYEGIIRTVREQEQAACKAKLAAQRKPRKGAALVSDETTDA
jgi:hypothetical protein